MDTLLLFGHCKAFWKEWQVDLLNIKKIWRKVMGPEMVISWPIDIATRLVLRTFTVTNPKTPKFRVLFLPNTVHWVGMPGYMMFLEPAFKWLRII